MNSNSIYVQRGDVNKGCSTSAQIKFYAGPRFHKINPVNNTSFGMMNI